MSADRPRNADFVQSLERGLLVIRAFDAEHRELGLSEVARATGLTRAAARRFLLTLVRLGYMSVARRALLAQPARARARLRVPVESEPARGRPAPHGDAGGDGQRVLVDLGPRRPRDRLRGPGADPPDHEHHALGGDPPARLPDLDGPGAAGRARRRRARVAPGADRARAAVGAHGHRQGDAARAARAGAQAGLRGHRPGARGGAAVAGRADPRRLGSGGRRAQRLGPRQPRSMAALRRDFLPRR